MNINSLSNSFSRLGVSGPAPKRSVLALYRQAQMRVDDIFNQIGAMEQRSKELIREGDQDALERHIHEYRHNLQQAFQKLPNTCPGPVLLEFFKAAAEKNPEQAFDALEELMRSEPAKALWIMDEIVSFGSPHEVYRYELLKFEQEIISRQCFYTEDFDEMLVAFVDRKRESPSPHMLAAYLTPLDNRLMIEYNIFSKNPREESSMDLLRRRLASCETLLKEDGKLFRLAEERFSNALHSLESLPMKVALASYFLELSQGQIKDPKTRLTALEILHRAKETCPDYFQITPINLPEA